MKTDLLHTDFFQILTKNNVSKFRSKSSAMALWDPEAAGNAAIYLRLPDIELIDVRNAPFDGKNFELFKGQ